MATAEIVDSAGARLTAVILISRAQFEEQAFGLANIAHIDFGLALRRGIMSGIVFKTADGFMFRVGLRLRQRVAPEVNISFPPRTLFISLTSEDFACQ